MKKINSIFSFMTKTQMKSPFYFSFTFLVILFAFNGGIFHGKKSAANTGTTLPLEVQKESIPILNIANIVESPKLITVLFQERAQPFTVELGQKEMINTLMDAFKAQRPLKFGLYLEKGYINSVTKLTDAELSVYLKGLPPRITGNKPIPFYINKDVLKLNTLYKDKLPYILGCKQNVIPDLKTAAAIFKFCAEQGCEGGSPTISPCISFQYAIDGCYARAHKMKDIIENRFGYCTQKVFSYGVNGQRLAVQTAQCCVMWWYHVAPLVQVRINNVNYCYVIDPSMFNEPVLLADWLAAQGNTGCNPSAGVTSYSIQPASAYSPASPYPVTNYATDPTYASTNSTLINYGSLHTCY